MIQAYLPDTDSVQVQTCAHLNQGFAAEAPFIVLENQAKCKPVHT